MLPPYLYSTYKQYKEDTNYVAKWLAQTAKDCGYSLPPPPPAPVASILISSIPRLRRIGKKQTSTTSAAPPQKQLVPTNDYSLLALHIVQYQPPVAVPISFINTVKRTIKARQNTSHHYNRGGTTPENDGHLHSIHVLESVLDILKPGPPAHHPNLTTKTTPTEMDDATNAYSGLEVEQPSENTAPAPKAASRSITPAPGIVEFEAEPMKKEEELEFAALCFMNDIDHIMDYVKDIWQKYADGKVELSAASIAAFHAVQTVMRLGLDFKAESDWFGDGLKVIQWCYPLRCASIGLDTWVSCDDPASRDAVTNGPLYTSPDSAQSTLLAISDILMDLERHDPNTVPAYEPGRYGIVDTSRPRCEKATKEKIEDDRIVLKDVLPLLRNAFAAEFDFQMHMPDAFLQLLHRYLSGEGPFSIPLAFAAQAYVEAYHIVGNRADSAFRELQALGQSIKMSAVATIKLNHQTKKDRANSTREAEKLLWVLDNNVLKDRAQIVATPTLAKNEVALTPPPNFALLKQHLLLCGTLAFMLRVSAQAVGLNYCNSWPSAIPCAHLFNAMHREELLRSAWPELGLMIEHQTAEKIYRGGRPKTPAQYHTRYLLCKGVRAEVFARNRRNKDFKHDPEGVVLVEKCSPVSSLLREMRNCKNDVDERDLAVLLNNLYQPAANGSTEKADLLTGVRRKRPLSESEKKHAKSMNTPVLSPKQLLQALEAAISYELNILKFDYMALHRQYWTLWERLKTKLPSTKASLPSSSSQFELIDLVTWVLHNYGACVAASEGMTKKQKKKAQAINPREELALFAGVVEEFLQELEQERTEKGQFEQLQDVTSGRDGGLVDRRVTMEDCVDEDENPENCGEPVCW